MPLGGPCAAAALPGRRPAQQGGPPALLLLLLLLLLACAQGAAGAGATLDGRRAAASSHWLRCGVVGALNGATGAVEDRRGAALQEEDCNTSLLTNCSVSYWPINCPNACPFLVEDPAALCFFKCVEAATCSEEDPELPFPDATFKGHAMCSRCSVDLCKYCSSETTCEECHEGFGLSDDGRSCVLNMKFDEYVYPVVVVLGALIVLLLLLALVWPCAMGVHGRASEHMVGLRRARLHRHLCKTADWQLDARRDVRQWYSVAENVHRRNIVGVGLPLFYNTLCFMILVATVCFVATYTLHNWFWLQDYAFGLGGGQESHADLVHFVEAHQGDDVLLDSDIVNLSIGRPGVVVSKLKECPQRAPGDEVRDLTVMADRLFWTSIGLYPVLFGLSLWMGGYQRRQAVLFESRHVTMRDFAIKVSGLPRHLTDEAEIRKKLEDLFRDKLPQKVKRPPKVELATGAKEKDKHVPRKPSQIEVYAVSLEYDWSSRRQVVEEAIGNFMEVQEVEYFHAAKADQRNKSWLERTYQDQDIHMSDTTMYDPADPATHDMTPDEAHRRIREKVLPLFEGTDKLESTGVAYVVFTYTTDQALVSEYVRENPHEFRWSTGEKLTFSAVTAEPTEIAWWSAGYSRAQIWLNVLWALGTIAVSIAFLLYCLNWQYYKYIQRPYREVGQQASGITTTVYGVIAGWVTGLVHARISAVCGSIGFRKKGTLYMFVLITSVINVAILEFLSIALLMKVEIAKYNLTDAGAIFTVSTAYIGVEMSFSRLVLNYLTGRWAGLFMRALMPQVNFMLHQTFQKIIYVWRCLPDPVLEVLKIFLPWRPPTLEHLPFRNAEKVADPAELGFIGDYVDWLIIPLECFCSMMFMSSYVWRTLWWLACFAVANYCYFRWVHLRCYKANLSTSDRLNTTYMYWWGCAIGVVAAQIPLWGFRSRRLFEVFGENALSSTSMKLFVLLATYLVAVVLWLFAYHIVCTRSRASLHWRLDLLEALQEVETSPRTGKTVQEVKMDFVYSWLNTNPAYALKCKYVFKDSRGWDTGHRKGHPLASGDDEDEVRFFEIGKEYLFLRPERFHLLEPSISDLLEPEYWLDRLIWRSRQFAEIFLKTVKDQAKDLDEEVQKDLEKLVGYTASQRWLDEQPPQGLGPDGFQGCCATARQKPSCLSPLSGVFGTTEEARGLVHVHEGHDYTQEQYAQGTRGHSRGQRECC